MWLFSNFSFSSVFLLAFCTATLDSRRTDSIEQLHTIRKHGNQIDSQLSFPPDDNGLLERAEKATVFLSHQIWKGCILRFRNHLACLLNFKFTCPFCSANFENVRNVNKKHSILKFKSKKNRVSICFKHRRSVQTIRKPGQIQGPKIDRINVWATVKFRTISFNTVGWWEEPKRFSTFKQFKRLAESGPSKNL